jgi:capsular polysaccharide biosynthesis protein
MAVAGGIGVVLALLLAALAERFSTRIVTPADVERRLGLPVLTTIPRES